MKITTTTLILFLSPVFSQKNKAPVVVTEHADYLVGKPNQQADLDSVMKAAGVKRLKCNPGYMGIDCTIPDSATMTKLSCYLKGKPGFSKGGVCINKDLENTGLYCPGSNIAPVAPTTYTRSTMPTAYTTPATSTAYATPTMPTAYTTPTTSTAYTTPAAPVACPLIVDIQKCMNKCVDDVLN
ncbi:hypothetical protein BB560_002364 [Smittium megazygosporum]|uniref:Uncharacterized protein n=1 Tax=Smittium megazygosporum TaxID=133381 RepID=A0A2T9ZF39_9FUNG|nr:hypothetical protein BB560_002364 [Smittium megazygosporum]